MSREEREEFATAMLMDVLEACGGHEVTVVSPEDLNLEGVGEEIEVRVDDSPLNEALESLLEPPCLILPADLPLLRGEDVEELVSVEGDVVVAPGLRGGTNGLLLRERIPLRYGGRSFERHLSEAEERGLSVAVHESFRFAVDVDVPKDLVELEVHGEGRAERALANLGLEL